MKVFVYILIFWVWGTAQAETPVVGSVHIYGNRAKSERLILETLSLKPRQPLPNDWPSGPIQRLIDAYQSEGFWFFRVDSIRADLSADSTKLDVSLWLTEGDAVRVRAVRIHGLDPAQSAALTRDWETGPGAVFDPTVLRTDIEEALTTLEDTGYPLSQVAVDSLTLDADSTATGLDVILKVDPGNLVRFGALAAKGNTVTRERVIVRESRIRSGDLYDQSRLRDAQDNLMRTGYFDSVDDPKIRFRDGQADVIFSVQEGHPNTIEGVAGYTPSSDEDKRGYFTGRLNFSFKNLLGTGRVVQIYWEKKDQTSQAMRVGYEEPWLLGYPLFAGGHFEQEIRDTTYLERNWRLSLRFSPLAALSLGVEGGQKSILPDSLGSVTLGLAQTEAWVLSGRIDYNTFNDLLNPRRGVHYHTALTTGRKRIVGPDFLLADLDGPRTMTTRRVEMDFEIAVPIARRHVFYAGLHGVEVKSGERYTPVTEQVRFGGATTVRGYAEDLFRGDLVAWFNFEHRYFLGRRSRVFVFLDGGMYQRREEVAGLVRGEKIGYGFGLRLETRLGLIGIDYGLGEGDGFMQGKVHVGLMNRF